jgi:hypothetical protein
MTSEIPQHHETGDPQPEHRPVSAEHIMPIFMPQRPMGREQRTPPEGNERAISNVQTIAEGAVSKHADFVDSYPTPEGTEVHKLILEASGRDVYDRITVSDNPDAAGYAITTEHMDMDIHGPAAGSPQPYAITSLEADTYTYTSFLPGEGNPEGDSLSTPVRLGHAIEAHHLIDRARPLSVTGREVLDPPANHLLDNPTFEAPTPEAAAEAAQKEAAIGAAILQKTIGNLLQQELGSTHVHYEAGDTSLRLQHQLERDDTNPYTYSFIDSAVVTIKQNEADTEAPDAQQTATHESIVSTAVTFTAADGVLYKQVSKNYAIDESAPAFHSETTDRQLATAGDARRLRNLAAGMRAQRNAAQQPPASI